MLVALIAADNLYFVFLSNLEAPGQDLSSRSHFFIIHAKGPELQTGSDFPEEIQIDDAMISRLLRSR